MIGESIETAAVGPLSGHLRLSVAEHVDGMMPELHLGAPLKFQFLDSALRDPRPDAQNIGVVVDDQGLADGV